MSLLSGLLAPIVCALVATGLQPVVIGLLRQGAVLDIPGQRSSHTVPTPRGGGVAVGLGLFAGLSVLAVSTWLPLAVALIVFFALGLAEDLYGVSVPARLALQLGAGLVVGALLVRGVHPLLLAVLLVVGIAVWVTAFANAFNFMDGVNGISAAHAMLGGLAFVGIGALRHDTTLIVVAAVVAAGGLAFLPWNAGRALVFLGDVGSYCIGAVLAVLAVHTVLSGAPVEAVFGPLALYVTDTGVTLARRIGRGATWLCPHREHAYQRLCDVGLSHQKVTVLTVGVGACVAGLGLVSLAGDMSARVVADVTAIALLAGYLATPRLLRLEAPARLTGNRAW